MKLRNWAKGVLFIISLIAFTIMASDCENLATFLISHIIACAVFALSTTTLIKYAK